MRLRRLVEQYRKVILFATIGACSGTIYFALIYALMEMFALDYRLAVSIAYLVALACHFFANRQFTFRAHNASLHGHLIRYAAMLVFNYFVTILMVVVAVKLFLTTAYVGAFIAIVMNMFSNYWLLKSWIFRNLSSQE